VRWLEETHGCNSNWSAISAADVRRGVVFDAGAVEVGGHRRFLAVPAAGILLVREGALDPKYASKYRLLAMAAGPAGVRAAAIADELALVTLLICVTG